jgi:hypothetical protein
MMVLTVGYGSPYSIAPRSAMRDYTSHRRDGVRCSSDGRPRRLGENDAWLVATTESIDADVVAADRSAFERLGARYLRFR